MFNFLLQIVPFFIPASDGGEFNITYRYLLLNFLVANTIFIIIYTIRALVWILWKKKQKMFTFKKYVIYDDEDNNWLHTLLNMVFIAENGLLLLIGLIKWLASVFNSII